MKINFLIVSFFLLLYNPPSSELGADMSDPITVFIDEINALVRQENFSGAYSMVSASNQFVHRHHPLPYGEYVHSYQYKDEFESGYIDHYFAFLFSIDNDLSLAEYYKFYGGGGFAVRGDEYHADNFLDVDVGIEAFQFFLSYREFSFQEAHDYLLNHGFFLHQNSHESGSSSTIIIKKPYRIGSIFERLGGNAIPNVPLGFCIQSSAPNSRDVSVLSIFECGFDRSLYSTQRNEILTTP